MYSLEQIEKIWLKARPLYYRLVEGEKANGLHRNTDFFEVKKTETLDDAKRTTESAALWTRFLAFLDDLNDGYYTVIIQANKTASASAAPYHFAKGDVSALPAKQAVGATQVRQNTEGGNWSAASQTPMMFMMDLWQRNNTQMMEMQRQNNDRHTELLQTLFKKDMEISTLGQTKGTTDKLFEVLKTPYFWNTIEKFAPTQTVAIGRAQAAVNEVVERQIVEEPTPPAPSQDAVNHLRSLLEKVAADNPGADPIQILNEGYDKAKAFLPMLKQMGVEV